MITIKNLVKTYNKNIVLNINELVINKGEITGLVGNNGAGKTTLFRLILDLIRADKGEVRSGKWLVAKTENWKEYTGSFLDEGFLIDFLTPGEFFHFIGNIYGLSPVQVDKRLAIFTPFFNNEILGQGKKYIRNFSKGNKQKIGLVSALLTYPEVLILDEPFNSLDPGSQILLKRILTEYNNRTGATIFISSHDLNHINDICERILLLEKGSILRDIRNKGAALMELNEYFSVKN